MQNCAETTRRTDVEFIALAALLISMVALSIDSLLPALGDIGHALDVVRGTRADLPVRRTLYGPTGVARLGLHHLECGTSP